MTKKFNEEKVFNFIKYKEPFEEVKKAIDEYAAVRNINTTNKYNWRLLTSAVESGVIEIVNYLLSIGADVNGLDKDRYSALHHAVKHQNCEIAEILLKAGAKADIADSTSQTAASLAAFSQNREMISLIESFA